MEIEGVFLNCLYEGSLTLILKLDKIVGKKENKDFFYLRF